MFIELINKASVINHLSYIVNLTCIMQELNIEECLNYDYEQVED